MLSLAFLHAEGSLGASDLTQAFNWFRAATEKGNHLLAWGNLAICYQHGLGTEKDPQKAAEIFKKHRDMDIICYLGTIEQAPSKTLTYEEELELNRAWAKKNDPHAQYIFGLRHLYGWGVEINYLQARDWLAKAAKKDHPRALNDLGVLYQSVGFLVFKEPDSLKRAAEYYRRAAEAGEATGMVNLAIAYDRGFGAPQNEAQAIAWFEKSLQANVTLGSPHERLGSIYKDRYFAARKKGDSVEMKAMQEKVLYHYKAAHELKMSAASLALGHLAFEGVFEAADYAKAYDYFTQSAEAGNIQARRMLGMMHERGLGVPVTYREAAYHYRIAALAGDLPALTSLCDFYLQGKGVSRDIDRATFWLQKLAQRGNPRAIMALGDIALNRGNYAEALKLFRTLANSPLPELEGYAYQQLARCYEFGWGVKANPARAKSYRAKALSLNNGKALYASGVALVKEGKIAEAIELFKKANTLPEAHYTLGRLYLAGHGVPKDLEKGFAHLRVAADAGSPEAQYALAAATLTSVPGAPPFGEALRLVELAENSGFEKARALREQLEASGAKANSGDAN